MIISETLRVGEPNHDEASSAEWQEILADRRDERSRQTSQSALTSGPRRKDYHLLGLLPVASSQGEAVFILGRRLTHSENHAPIVYARGGRAATGKSLAGGRERATRLFEANASAPDPPNEHHYS